MPPPWPVEERQLFVAASRRGAQGQDHADPTERREVNTRF
jgi:hypothetical protein